MATARAAVIGPGSGNQDDTGPLQRAKDRRIMTSQGECRIYVACLASYNAGRLHGRWIDAAQDADDIRAEIAAMLAESPEAGAEEWAVHDWEGFPDSFTSEWPDLDRVAELAAAIEEHGEAFLAYLDAFGDCDTSEDDFQDRYRGEHNSPADFAQDFCEECYDMREVPDWLRFHIDWDSVANDMRCSGYVLFHDFNGTLYVFWNT